LEVAVSADAGPLARNPRGRRLRGLVARGAHPPGRDAIDALERAHRAAHPRADLGMLRHAYEVAEQLHRGQQRRSGEPFITHPLAVAVILADLGVDTTTLVAALLHDTVEDTVYTLEQARAEFGEEVAQLVDGVTKLDKLRFGEAAEAETIRKLILAMARDLRVLVIKLADRVHNMRTLGFQPPHKQERIARATLDVLVPLADRLGIQVFKRELEDLAFATLQPAAYERTTVLVSERAAELEAYLREVVDRLEPALREAGVKATMSARLKHLFSVHHTLLERGDGTTDVYDVARLLIVVAGDAPSCYVAMGALHGRWKPVLGRFKDFIAMPKFNLYQSLHTTVIGPHDELLQVLIRTEEMHRAAEHGIVARLREGGGRNAKRPSTPAGGRPDDLDWLRRMVDWQQDAPDPGQFLESLRYDLSDHEIVLFSPKGDAITLPEGATPVDFAYALGTDTGHRCVGARVNGQLVPLANPLSDGDVVEVLTTASEGTGPSKDWLDFVKTPQAQLGVRQWFIEQRRQLAIEAGTQAVGWALREAGRDLGTTVEDGSLARAAAELRYAGLDDLFEAVGETLASPAWVVQQLLSAPYQR
jgi:GTP diphosphokinase / guanosine-3',5'-bis(diphosphate) 3'-diphosphatase